MNQPKKKAPAHSKKSKLHFPSVVPGMPIETMKSEQTDPFGSYTGNAINNEIPVQDADDL